MSLNLGELTAYLRADDSDFNRGLTAADMRMAGFQRDTDGRLRDLHGRFASESSLMGRELGRIGDNDGPNRATSRMRGFTSAIGAVGGALTSMPAMIAAGIPVASGLAAALVSIAPAAAIGATAVLSLAQATAAIKIGTSGVGAAITAAFAPATGGASSATNAANQYAQAQRALKTATEQAAYANEQAARQVTSAERNLSDAQKAAQQAQMDLTQARKDAARQLQDMNNSLADAELSQRQAVLDVHSAEANLQAVRAKGSAATKDQIAQAQLQYETAVQRLKEQTTATERLRSDTAAANKAGVEGSQTVVAATQKVADAQRTVGDNTVAVQDAHTQMARTAAAGLDSIRKAQEALAAAAVKNAGGVNALAAAMAKLSPNARAFVQQIIALKPAWDALKLGVQDALFQGLAGTLRTTASAVLPILHRELTNSASALNAMAKGAAGAAKNLATSGVLGAAMHSASQGLHNLSGVPGIVVTAFGQLAAAAGPSFQQLTSAVGGAAATIGQKLSDAFKSGAMQSAIETAVGLIKELATVAGNVLSVIGSVMKATQQTGGGFIGTLVTISATLKDTFASPAVQDGLKALFSTMSVLAKTAAPLLDQALRAIAPVLTALGPPVQALIEALGKALSPIIEALGPVLAALATAVGDIVVAALPFLKVISDLIVIALKPLTPIIQKIGEIFVALAPGIARLADLFGSALTPVLMGLAEVLVQVATQFGDQLLAMLPDLIRAAIDLAPVFVQLAQSVGQILLQLAPLLPKVMMLSEQMTMQLLPAVLPLLGPLADLAVVLLQIATDVITNMVIPALDTLIGWFGTMQAGLQPAWDAVKWLTDKVAGAFEWLADHLVGHSVIPDMINSIVRWFAGLPGRAWRALSSLGSLIVGQASAAGSRMLSTIGRYIDAAIRTIGGLPGRAARALGDLGGYLYGSGQSLIAGFINGIISMGSQAANAASWLVQTVRDFFPHSPAKKGPFSGRGWTQYSGEAIALAMASGMRSGEGAVSSAALSLMGTAQRGLAIGPDTPMANLVTSPTAATSTGTGSRGSSTPGSKTSTPRVVIDVTGADEAWKTVLRRIVRTDGSGSADVAFA